MSYEDIKKVQKKYAWFIDNNQLALVEKLNNGTWGSVTEANHDIRVNVTKLADHFTETDTGVDSFLDNGILNPSFSETSGAGTFDSWSEVGGTAEVNTIQYQSTPNSCTLTVSNNVTIKQEKTLVPGKTYRISFYLYSHENGQPKFEIYDETNSTSFYAKENYPTLASWNQYNYEFTVPSNGSLYSFKFSTMPGLGTAISIDTVALEEKSSGLHEYLLESPEFPEQFHMAIVYKALSDFYKLPNMRDLEMAQYYELEYIKFIKKAKTYGKAGHLRTGRIVCQDF